MFYYPNKSIIEIIIYRLKKTIYSRLLYWQDRISRHEAYRSLIDLKDSKTGKRAFVFANGPSLSILNPLKIKDTGYDIVAVNGYLWSDFSNIAKPTHYVLSDPVCFLYDSTSVSASRNHITNKYSFILKEIMESGISLFVPTKYLDTLPTSRKNIFGFCDIENELSKNIMDITKPRGYLSMTAYKALAISLYLGYDRIYICGFDNDYFKYLESNIDNQLFYTDKHFFDSGKKLNASSHANSVAEYLYKDHFLFSHLSKFPKSRLCNLDPKSLNTYFEKKHNLDVYNHSEFLK